MEPNMSRDKVTYEWAIEEADEDGDIFNVDHADTLAEALDRQRESLSTAAETGAASVRVALLRITNDDIDGEQERFYAYLNEDGSLPEIMETCDEAQDGPPVPQRFHKEAAAIHPFAEAA
jgi:hypothetical protein